MQVYKPTRSSLTHIIPWQQAFFVSILSLVADKNSYFVYALYMLLKNGFRLL